MNKFATHLPLVIDFDKTLSEDDLLIKSFFALTLAKKIYVIIFILTRGRLFLKKYFFYNNLMTQKVNFNKEIIKLAISHNAFIVSGSLDVFLKKLLKDMIPKNKIFGSQETNLTGKQKRKFLIAKFGYKKFNYIGDSFSDISVWRESYQPYTVRRLFIYRLFISNLKHINEIK